MTRLRPGRYCDTLGAMIPAGPRFLVVDENGDTRFLLVKTLLRKFPSAAISECGDLGMARRMVAEFPPAVVVAHRTAELQAPELARHLRALLPEVPIVMVSPLDCTSEAPTEGPNSFLPRDEWLRIGSTVAELLGRGSQPPFGSNDALSPAADRAEAPSV